MNKRKSPIGIKIIACLLLLGSLACCLLPWMKISIDVGVEQERMNPGELIQTFLGMDAAAAKDNAIAALRGEGVPFDAEALTRLLDRLLDGHFKLPDFPSFCGELGSFCRDFQRPELGRSLDTVRLVCWIALALLALLWILALCCQLTDHRWGILPYLLLAAVITAGLYVLRAELNRYLMDEGDALLAGLGLNVLISYLHIGMDIVKMGIGALLCPFLALLALLFSGIRKKAPAKSAAASPYPARRVQSAQPRPAPAREGGWVCPGCGRRCGPDENFCKICGSERPRLPALQRCPGCGESLPPDATFCSACGADLRLPREATSFPRPDGGET